MPYKENEIKKIYYSIGEVAEMFKVSTSLVRYWENEFEILKPKKNKKGNRFFTNEDIENLKIIFHLVKERGFTLEGAKNKLKENKSDTVDNARIINSLRNLKSFLEELKKEI